MTEQEIEFRASRRNDAVEKAADAMYLAAVLAQLRSTERAYVAAIDAALLNHIGRALSAVAIRDCNYGGSKGDETRRANLAKQAATIAAWYGLTVTTYGDPRGYVLRLHGPGLPQNGWGEGFGVA